MLENILIKYFGLNEDWNDTHENENNNWYSSYSKLTSLIYELGELGVLNANEIVDKLDKIDNEESEFVLEVERLYDERLMKTENRGMSYGEIAYIESLSKEELNKLYEELLESEED